MFPRPERCTCSTQRPRGPPWDDGSEDGPCAYCEAVDDGATDEDYEAMINYEGEA